MSDRLMIVRVSYDDEAGVWYTSGGDIPGLAAEADTLEHLMQRIPGMVMDLLEVNGFSFGDDREVGPEISLEIISHASARVRLPVAA